jgi:hypothetical protein
MPPFFGDLSIRVLPERQRPSLFHYPPVDVLVADPADGDHPPEPIAGALFAADGPLADPIGERQRRLLPSAVRLAGDGAELLGLRRVDAVRRTRSPRTSMVSPSTTLARPTTSACRVPVEVNSATISARRMRMASEYLDMRPAGNRRSAARERLNITGTANPAVVARVLHRRERTKRDGTLRL